MVNSPVNLPKYATNGLSIAIGTLGCSVLGNILKVYQSWTSGKVYLFSRWRPRLPPNTQLGEEIIHPGGLNILLKLQWSTYTVQFYKKKRSKENLQGK